MRMRCPFCRVGLTFDLRSRLVVTIFALWMIIYGVTCFLFMQRILSFSEAIVVLVLKTFILLCLMFRTKLRTTTKGPMCLFCGYDTYQAAGEDCPECGTNINDKKPKPNKT